MNSRMILCGGLQSGGTTLVSWCFLQRQDTNGVLDMYNGVIQTSFEKVVEPILWVKMTVGAFHWLDVYETYRDLGWKPEPLLVVRDARAAYSSLLGKRWGHNGTTGDEPPLRMRFRRFLRDWELFRSRGWPVIKYEDFVQEGQAVLKRTCEMMSLPWDEGMVSWPKSPSEIAYFSKGNETFFNSLSQGSLEAAKRRDKARIKIDKLPQAELRWLEETFSEYNRFHGYPVQINRELARRVPLNMPAPSFEGTSMHWWVSEYDRLRTQLVQILEQELAAIIPQGETVILVDENELGATLAGYRRLPWRSPPDDVTALRELEQLRQTGASFIAFGWPAFWWLDLYVEFSAHLRAHFRCVLENDRVVVFDLRP